MQQAGHLAGGNIQFRESQGTRPAENNGVIRLAAQQAVELG